jgi:hypothetical protein
VSRLLRLWRTLAVLWDRCSGRRGDRERRELAARSATFRRDLARVFERIGVGDVTEAEPSATRGDDA